jgi:hypothetical protein
MLFKYIMDEYVFNSSTTPLQNASVLYVSGHGTSYSTLFTSIRELIGYFIQETKLTDTDQLERDILKDVFHFIYTKVLYSPIARTNTLGFVHKNT